MIAIIAGAAIEVIAIIAGAAIVSSILCSCLSHDSRCGRAIAAGIEAIFIILPSIILNLFITDTTTVESTLYFAFPRPSTPSSIRVPLGAR